MGTIGPMWFLLFLGDVTVAARDRSSSAMSPPSHLSAWLRPAEPASVSPGITLIVYAASLLEDDVGPAS